MLTLHLSKAAKKCLQSVHPRYARQIKVKLLSLSQDPYPHDTKQLKGYSYYRTDMGEYRIIYQIEKNALKIVLIGKRNDGEVYKKLGRLS